MIEPEEHFDAIDEIKAGTMDIAITEPLHLVQDRAKDEPVIGFARFLHTNGGVMYLKNKGINRPQRYDWEKNSIPGSSWAWWIIDCQNDGGKDGGTCTLMTLSR